MRIIRASEIGEYLYCQRAWWYASQGYQSNNRLELEGGGAFHRKHAHLVFMSGCLRILSMVFLTTSLIILIAYLLGTRF